MGGGATEGRAWTVPNLISAARILGVIPLLWLAWEGERLPFLWVMLFLLATDWIDGKLAVALDCETIVGARLDSAADALMYAAFALAFWWLEGDAVRREIGWLLAVLATWGLSGAIGLVRFGRLPSYHTLGAKVSWFVVGVVAVIWLVTGRAGAVPWALGLVILTNVEAAMIGLVLPQWRANVPTLLHALGIRRAWRGEGP